MTSSDMPLATMEVLLLCLSSVAENRFRSDFPGTRWDSSRYPTKDWVAAVPSLQVISTRLQLFSSNDNTLLFPRPVSIVMLLRGIDRSLQSFSQTSQR